MSQRHSLRALRASKLLLPPWLPRLAPVKAGQIRPGIPGLIAQAHPGALMGHRCFVTSKARRRRIHSLICLVAGLTVALPARGLPLPAADSPERQEAQAATEKARELVRSRAPFDAVIPAFAQAVAHWRRVGDRKELLLITNQLVAAYIAKGDLREAMRLNRETLASLQSATSRDDIELKRLFLVTGAMIASNQGDEQQAINARQIILDDVRQQRDTIDAGLQVGLLLNNAWSFHRLGQHQKALATLEEAKNVRRRHPYPSSLATILASESVLLQASNLPQASAKLQQALAVLSALPAAEARVEKSR